MLRVGTGLLSIPRLSLTPALLLLASFGAQADTVTGYFIAPMFGSTFGGELKATDVEEDGDRESVGKLKIDDDTHFGVMLGIELSTPGNVYLLYSKQGSSFKEDDFAPSNGVDVDVSYYHFGGTLYFPNGNFEPYVTSSIGAIQLKPSGDFSDEWAVSFAVGIGASYYLTDNVSLFADVRGFFSGYDQSRDLVCPDDNDNCVVRIENDALIQTQANLGVKIRF